MWGLTVDRAGKGVLSGVYRIVSDRARAAAFGCVSDHGLDWEITERKVGVGKGTYITLNMLLHNIHKNL